ncbi:MAG: hypothetical protein ABI543_13875 [Ignavibacteria bacterium]
MNSNYYIRLIFAIILFSFCTGIFSQNTVTKRYMVVRSSPRYTLTANIDYNQSLLELSGAYNDDYQSVSVFNGETFGADKGYGLSLISKIALNERGSFRFTQSLTYNRILSYTFGDKTTIADNGKANYNCFTGGVGIEYNFTPAHKFKMFMGAEMNASMINGTISVWFENRGFTPYNEYYKVNNSVRLGYGLTFGSEYLINEGFGLNIAVRMINANALLKEANGTNADKDFRLRDDTNPNLKFAGNNRKNFSFYSIMLGVNFYFGIKEKKYKLN